MPCSKIGIEMGVFIVKSLYEQCELQVGGAALSLLSIYIWKNLSRYHIKISW